MDALQPISLIYVSVIADIRYIRVRYSRYTLYMCPIQLISVIYVSVIADIRYIRVRYSRYPLYTYPLQPISFIYVSVICEFYCRRRLSCPNMTGPKVDDQRLRLYCRIFPRPTKRQTPFIESRQRRFPTRAIKVFFRPHQSSRSRVLPGASGPFQSCHE